jgi:hypothetical protein
MSIPTTGETYSKLMEYLRKAQEESAMMSHLVNAQGDRELSTSWLKVSENFRKMQHLLTQLAMGKLN